MPTMVAMTSSRVRCVVSTCTAPSASTSGDEVRVVSIWSRARSESRVASTSLPPSSAARRTARAAGVRGEVDLDGRVRPDDRPDVAALDDYPVTASAVSMIVSLHDLHARPHPRDRAHR